MKRNFIAKLAFAFLAISISTACFAEKNLIITLDRDDLFDFHQVVGSKSPLEITNFNHPNARREVVDIILLLQALTLGGVDVNIKFEQGAYYARNLYLLEQGKLALSPDTVWQQDIDKISEHVYISDTIIEDGEFYAGFYTSPNNHKALKAKSLTDLKQLRFVSNKHWSADWKALSDLSPITLVDEPKWLSMARSILHDHYDAMLISFRSDPSLQVYVPELQAVLVPIPNLKIQLRGSMHYIVSKNHPDGAMLFKALNKGIAMLKQQGRYKKAYQEVGFFNQYAQNWQLIEP
ncbi:hypothetical protein HR060_03030 [Catenovulum sp. SM1970]|uniref:hypothetical protein n=1 Tax=Marinifaba aquimaris TaxID=2741323 RepID=UPI001571B824|nr:hypothetical protein [Marinifaba aquimaris]NTS75830.1 hypothetical protein [Marinifaba aquimaris]